MTGKDARRVSQRQFLRTVEERAAAVRYEYPGRFRAGGLYVKIEPHRLGTFLGKLGAVLPFKDYDRLSREVWVAHMRAEADAVPLPPEP